MRTRFDGEDAALLKAQEREFTNEGAPPPGVVGTDLQGEPIASCVAERESPESLVARVRVAEQERDALATFTQEELYLRACANVDAIERLLEDRTGNLARRPQCSPQDG